MAKRFSINWDKVNEKIKEGEKTGAKKDERFYTLKPKESGTASAIIRFLPAPDHDVPYVKLYSHGFKEHNNWYINNCPTTIGEECPVCKANRDLWDDDPDTVRARSRRLSCYTNILIIKDPQNPENEGKVFLYRYGKKIHEKVMARIDPPEDSIEEPIKVFDYYEGANFKLIVKLTKTKERTYPNYDDSGFSEPTPLFKGDDDKIEKVHNERFGIAEFIAPEQFKPYSDLEERFNKVVGTEFTKSTPKSESKSEEEIPDDGDDDDNVEFQSNDEFLSKLRKNV